MPRTTRSSTRARDKVDEEESPKKIIPDGDLELQSPSKTRGRQSRKNLPSPATPKNNKRRKQSESEDDSSSTSTPRKATRSSRSSARPASNISEIVPAESTTRKSSKRPTDAPDCPTPKKKTSSIKTTPRSGKRTRKNEEEEESEENDVETKRPRTESPLIKLKLPLPRRLSRVELYDEALKNLASRLDLFDLTDRAESTNVWCDWPNVDAPAALKDIHTILLSRGWYPPTESKTNSASLNGGNNGVVSQENAETTSGRDIDVISYCLLHLNPESPDFKRYQSVVEKELSAYRADIYCFQNVNPACQTVLRDILKSKGCGFSAVAGSNLIAFQLEHFNLLSQHQVSALDFANQIVHECAYPVTWCKSIKAALGDGEVDEMLISVLVHKSTGQLILVASHSLLPSDVHRPDITALNITGAIWNLARIWNENSNKAAGNGPTNGTVHNGLRNGASHLDVAPRWLLCGPFNATERSPIYQLARDGYPNDSTLDRLRCLKTVKLPKRVSLHATPIDPEEDQEMENSPQKETSDPESLQSKALIDLLWNAFQHPCKDVTSCYQAVLGREPPFTRVPCGPVPRTGISSAIDYIWCSGTTLEPQKVLLPPCRALDMALSGAKAENGFPNVSMPLLARMSMVSTAS